MNTAVVTRTALRHCGLPERAGGRRRAPGRHRFRRAPDSRASQRSRRACCWGWFSRRGIFRADRDAALRFSRPRACAAITIVVTASHNPRGDNGYKSTARTRFKSSRRRRRDRAPHRSGPPARLVSCQAVDFDAPSGSAPDAAAIERPRGYLQPFPRQFPPAPSVASCPIVHSALHGVALCHAADACRRRVHSPRARRCSGGARWYFSDQPFRIPRSRARSILL